MPYAPADGQFPMRVPRGKALLTSSEELLKDGQCKTLLKSNYGVRRGSSRMHYLQVGLGKVFIRPVQILMQGAKPGRVRAGAYFVHMASTATGRVAGKSASASIEEGVDYKPGSVTLKGSVIISLAGSPDRGALVRPTWVKGRAILTVSRRSPFWPCIGWGLQSHSVA